MRDKFIELCGHEFERGLVRHVQKVFEAKRGWPYEFAETPWLGGPYRPRAPRAQYAETMISVCRALAARERFDAEAPSWAQKIGLPLREDECLLMCEDPDQRIRLLGHYGLDLRMKNWRAGTYSPFDEAFVQLHAA
jgi:hypothetical protein